MESEERMEALRKINKDTWRAKDALCKKCFKNPKRDASRYCQPCSDEHKKSINQ